MSLSICLVLKRFMLESYTHLFQFSVSCTSFLHPLTNIILRSRFSTCQTMCMRSKNIQNYGYICMKLGVCGGNGCSLSLSTLPAHCASILRDVIDTVWGNGRVAGTDKLKGSDSVVAVFRPCRVSLINLVARICTHTNNYIHYTQTHRCHQIRFKVAMHLS